MKVEVPVLPLVYNGNGKSNSLLSKTHDDDSVQPSNFMCMGPDFQRYLAELGSDANYQSSCSSSHDGAAGPVGRATHMDAIDGSVLAAYLEERCVFFKRTLDALLLCEQSKAGQQGHVQRSAACLEEEWRHLINCLWHIHTVENTKYQKFPLLPVV